MDDWEDRVRAALPDFSWVDDGGDLNATEPFWNDEDAEWSVWLWGERMRLAVGCVMVESDIIDGDYAATAHALGAAVRAWASPAEVTDARR